VNQESEFNNFNLSPNHISNNIEKTHEISKEINYDALAKENNDLKDQLSYFLSLDATQMASKLGQGSNIQRISPKRKISEDISKNKNNNNFFSTEVNDYKDQIEHLNSFIKSKDESLEKLKNIEN